MGDLEMIIMNATDIRQNYNKIADLCRGSGKPVCLAKNGVADLVIMDLDSFQKREKMLELREKLVMAEEDRAAGQNNVSVSVLDEAMRLAIAGATKK